MSFSQLLTRDEAYSLYSSLSTPQYPVLKISDGSLLNELKRRGVLRRPGSRRWDRSGTVRCAPIREGGWGSGRR